MDIISQLSIVIILLIEVSTLTYIEYKAWNTIYTPLCILMLPYVFVLLITIAIAGNWGFVKFNYESIYIWIYGLPLFALPSYAFAAYLRYKEQKVIVPIKEEKKALPNILLGISIIVIILLLIKLYQTFKTGQYLFGTDDFADDFSGHGFWAHVRTLLTPILILSIYNVKKRQYWLWALISLILLIQIVNMVKGTIVIPIIAAILFRLYTQKTRFNFRLILFSLIGGLLVFFLLYMILPLLGNGGEANMDLVEFVAKHFVHYFTSGTFGWSFDIDQGIPDQNDFSYIVAPFVNIYHTITGQQIILPVNPFYWNIGNTMTTYTNVRTFFGTLYIYTDFTQFITYTLVLSTFIYSWKVFALLSRNTYIYIILFYYCSLLAMGWFEFYFFHLDAIEIPLFTLLFMGLTKLIASDKNNSNQEGKEVALVD